MDKKFNYPYLVEVLQHIINIPFHIKIIVYHFRTPPNIRIFGHLHNMLKPFVIIIFLFCHLWTDI